MQEPIEYDSVFLHKFDCHFLNSAVIDSDGCSEDLGNRVNMLQAEVAYNFCSRRVKLFLVEEVEDFFIDI